MWTKRNVVCRLSLCVCVCVVQPPSVSTSGLSGVSDSLPYDNDTVFGVNVAFTSPTPVVQLHRVTPQGTEDSGAGERSALMAFRRDVIEAMAVQAVKGRDKVTIPGVIATVQAKLADRFDVTKTVRVLCFAWRAWALAARPACLFPFRLPACSWVIVCLRCVWACCVQDIEDRIENLVATGVLQKGLSAGASLANDATFCVWLAPDPSDDGGVEESKSFAGEGESETKSGDPGTDAEAMPPIKSPSLMRQYSVDDVGDTDLPAAVAVAVVLWTSALCRF